MCTRLLRTNSKALISISAWKRSLVREPRARHRCRRRGMFLTSPGGTFKLELRRLETAAALFLRTCLLIITILRRIRRTKAPISSNSLSTVATEIRCQTTTSGRAPSWLLHSSKRTTSWQVGLKSLSSTKKSWAATQCWRVFKEHLAIWTAEPSSDRYRRTATNL